MFAPNVDLNKHMSMHTGDKHIKLLNVKKNNFSRHHHLTNHTVTHTGETPHKCAQCKKTFTQNSHFIAHMRIHSQEKTYECDSHTNFRQAR